MASERRPRPKVKWIARDRWDSLVDAAATDRREELLGVRDQALIALGLSAALRVSELCNLNVEDLELEERRLFVACGKGGKSGYVYFSEDAKELLESWLQVRPAHPEDTERTQRGPLWISRKGNRLSTRQAREIVDGAGQRAGLGHLHPHQLRHSCATELLKRTGNIRLVQKHLRHARITTTEIYAQIVDTDLQKGVSDL